MFACLCFLTTLLPSFGSDSNNSMNHVILFSCLENYLYVPCLPPKCHMSHDATTPIPLKTQRGEGGGRGWR